MKKMISVLLAALMVLGCASAFAQTYTNTDGPFPISFDAPEGMEVISQEWSEYAGTPIFQASVKGSDDLSYYFAISGPDTSEENEDLAGNVTFKEEEGFTDEYLKDMVKATYGDEFDDINIGFETTEHGTKLVVIRIDDAEAPLAMFYTVYKGYEFSLTAISGDPLNGEFKPLTDEQIEKVVAFISDIWMGVEAKVDETVPTAE